MRLLDSYSASSALRHGQMELADQFFPLPFEDKYIVIVTSTGMPAKNYSYYAMVLDKLRPALNKAGYKVIQLGLKDDEKIRADLDLCGRTTIPQYFNLIKRAELVLSGDTSCVHAAGHYNTKIVALYSISSPDISGAEFGERSRQRYLVPPNYRPSFNPNENPKSIDTIKIEDVVKTTLELLELEYHPFETVFIGPDHRICVLETVPNTIVRPDFLAGQPLNVRFDKGGKEDLVYQQLQFRKSIIVTNKPLNIQYLCGLRPNIEGLIYLVSEEDDLNFVSQLHKNALPYRLISFLPQEEIAKRKIDYIDFNIIERREIKKRADVNGEVGPQTKFQSNKRILSNGKFYLTYAHLESEKSLDKFEQNEDTIIDTPSFWEDLDFFWIYNDRI